MFLWSTDTAKNVMRLTLKRMGPRKKEREEKEKEKKKKEIEKR